MKNILKLIGIAVLVSAIGFSMVSCDDDASGGGGGMNLSGSNWVDSSGLMELRFTSSSNYNIRGMGIEMVRGNYSVSGSRITITVTYINPLFDDGGIRVGETDTLTIIDNNTLRDNAGNYWTRSGGGGGGGGAGTLIINGIPSGQYNVYINENTTPTTQYQSNMLTSFGYIAGNTHSSTSPFALFTFWNSSIPFSETGRFIVILQGGNSVNRFLSNVQFTNGSATINFSSMTDVNTLPMF